METVLLVIHLILALALIGMVLIQSSEGGGLGMGGGSGGGMGGFMTARGTANFLTRTTGILAACFMGTSLLLAVLANQRAPEKSLLDLVAEDPAPIGMSIEDVPAEEAEQSMPDTPPEAPVSQ